MRGALLLTLAAAATTTASADAALPAAPAALPQLWGIQVDGRALPLLDRVVMRKARKAGVVLIADPSRLTAAEESRLASIGARAGLEVVRPLAAADPAAGAAACAALKRGRLGVRCGLMAGSAPTARALSRDASADLVLVRMPTARAFAKLGDGAGSSRMMGILSLPARAYGAGRWRGPIAAARKQQQLDLAVRPAGPRSRGALLRFLSHAARGGADHAPPSRVPVKVTGADFDTVTITWSAARDRGRVVGYGLYRDGARVGSTSARVARFTGLTCSAHVLEVDAVDRAGNRSAKSAVIARPSTCGVLAHLDPVFPPPTGGPADTSAPTTPGAFRRTAATRTSVSLSWDTSTDDRAIAGYRVYRDGQLAGATQTTAFVVSGLACGTSYEFAVEAFDDAANVSSRAIRAAATEACPDPTLPSIPTNLRTTSATATSVTLAWDASTDDVGVMGYRVYLDGELNETVPTEGTTIPWLTCGTAYQVAVEAYDETGQASERATLGIATLECDDSPPLAPGGLKVVDVAPSSITLSWLPAADDRHTSRYLVDQDGEMAGSTADTSLLVPVLECGTTYELDVRALDSAGNVSPRTTLEAATGACPDPAPEEPPATVFVATDGSDANPCTKLQPCAGFDRAYREAAPGDVVEVAEGRYGDQVILAVAGRTGPDVVLRPAAGARVVLEELVFGDGSDSAALGPDNITVRGMHGAYRLQEPGAGNQEGIFVGPGSSHITLEDMDAGNVQAYRASHLTVRGGDYGPCDAVWGDTAPAVCGNTKIDVSTDVLIDGARFHDYRFDETCFTQQGAECHWECIYLNGGERVTIRNSRFYGCAIFDIFATISGPDAGLMGHDGLTIENNWLAAPWTEGEDGGAPARAAAVSLSWCQNSDLGYRNVRVRSNSFEVATGLELDQNEQCNFEDVQITANLMAWDGCQERWAFTYNAWSTQLGSGTCSVTERVVGDSFPYVQPRGGATMDFHLAGPVGPADDIAPAASCPATDIDGQPRAVAGLCDAGADDRPGPTG